MRWPWQARETRADSSYTDALVAAITANAGGQSTAFPTATAALEAAAGVVGRAFAAGEVRAPDAMRDALGPACLSMIGRSLIRRGEIVFLIKVDGDRVKLLPAASHDIQGDPDPDSWSYRLTVGGPERTLTYPSVPAARRDPPSIFTRSRAPLAWLRAAPGGAARRAPQLRNRCCPGGRNRAARVVPCFHCRCPAMIRRSTCSRPILKSSRGNWPRLKPSSRWRQARAGSNDGWIARRIGAAPPTALVQLHEIATREVLERVRCSARAVRQPARRDRWQGGLETIAFCDDCSRLAGSWSPSWPRNLRARSPWSGTSCGQATSPPEQGHFNRWSALAWIWPMAAALSGLMVEE